MHISRIEGFVGPKSSGHMQRITREFVDGKLIQTGETIEHGKTTFKEVIEKGHNYFKRTMQSFNKDGELIKDSEFTEEIIGEAANKREIRRFGVIA